MFRKIRCLYPLIVGAFLVVIPLGKVAESAASQASTESPYSNPSAAYQINLPLIANQVPDERTILLVFYQYTRGESWYDHYGWNTDIPYCDWYGVICDKGGHVTSLIMDYNWLVGTIPPELGYLNHLTVLKLNHHMWNYGDLTGPLPAEIGNLVNLQTLDLSDNELSGTVPPEIGKLANLQELDLSNNNLGGEIPNEIGKLVNLQLLDLSHNGLYSGVLYPIPGNPAFPSEIGKLVNLVSLDLSNNILVGPIPVEIGSLPNLTVLKLDNNTFCNKVGDCYGINGPIPVELGNLTNLTLLDLTNDHLSGTIPAALSNLNNLEWLGLEGNPLDCWETQAALDWALSLLDYLGPTQACAGLRQ